MGKLTAGLWLSIGLLVLSASLMARHDWALIPFFVGVGGLLFCLRQIWR